VLLENSPESLAIAPDREVTLHFSLMLEDGQLIDSTRGRSPGTFVLGDETLPPKMARLLIGLKAGEERSFVVKPQMAFGEYNEKNIQQIPRENFDADQELSEGMVMEFAGPAGYQLPGVIRKIMDGLVIVDFNHPLAGRTLIFEVQILKVAPKAEIVELR